MKIQVLTAMKMMLYLWAVTPCGFVGRSQRFSATYCLSSTLETLVSTYKFMQRYNPEDGHRNLLSEKKGEENIRINILLRGSDMDETGLVLSPMTDFGIGGI